MSRFTKIAAVVAVGLAAGGCAFSPKDVQAAANPSLYSMHQPLVERTDYVIDLAAGPQGVSPSELSRLDAWFRSLELRYGDRIAVDQPSGYTHAEAAADVASVAARYGLLVSEGAPITAGAVSPGSVRVVASRSVATVPGCPLWSDPGIVASTMTSPNYGCATNSNLAAMIANPDDLVLGQPGSVDRSASTATRAIRGYREVQPTGRKGLSETQTTDN